MCTNSESAAIKSKPNDDFFLKIFLNSEIQKFVTMSPLAGHVKKIKVLLLYNPSGTLTAQNIERILRDVMLNVEMSMFFHCCIY